MENVIYSCERFLISLFNNSLKFSSLVSSSIAGAIKEKIRFHVKGSSRFNFVHFSLSLFQALNVILTFIWSYPQARFSVPAGASVLTFSNLFLSSSFSFEVVQSLLWIFHQQHFRLLPNLLPGNSSSALPCYEKQPNQVQPVFPRT